MSAKSAVAKASIARAEARATSERDKSTGKPAKLEQLAGLVGQADALGIDTTQARGMLAQDEAEGYKRYKGSTYEKSAKGGKRYEPTILSTVGGKAKFDSKIMPAVTKANEGIASLGVTDTTTDTTPREKTENAMLQAEYDATKTPEQLASDTYISSLTKESEAMTKAYDDMSKASARTARADISALKQQYRQRKAALEESNRTEYNQTQQSFIRSGQAEYSPTMTAGFLSAREREGQQRVAELNDQYLSKVDAINLALEEKEYANVASEVKAMKEIEEKIRVEVQNQAKIAKEETQAIEDRKNMVEVANYLAKNPTSDPISVFAQFGGKVPFDTIKGMMPTPAEDFTLSEGQARFDAKGNLIASRAKTYEPKGGGGGGSTVITPVGKPMVDGIGSTYENSSFEAQMVMDDIMNKIPVQLKNTEKEVALKYEQIRKQLAAGYTYQQIVDRLSGFSLQENADKQLGNSLYDMSLGTDLDIGQLASQLNRGANEQAMTSVENAKLKDADGFFATTDKARATVNQANTVLKLLDDPDFPKDALGAFDGRKFKVEKFFGLNDEERVKVQQLESALQLLASPIRVEVAGTAATPSEMDKISAFQSDILDQPDTIKTQVTSLRDSVLGFHNEARSQRGLPTVANNELSDNKARLNVYKNMSARQIQEYSNADLDAEIDSKLGGSSSKAGAVDANGYPL